MQHKPKNYIAQGLKPYQPGLPIELVAREYNLDPKSISKLASNENPLGMSPKAMAAFKATLADSHRYPEQYELTNAIAEHCHVQPANVVIGNGSNDVIDLIARVYLGEGDEAVLSQYAFAMYQIAVQTVGAKCVVVPAKDYGHDLPAMQKAITPKTKVVWIANPNNPTGTFVSYAELKEFIKSVPPSVVVVLDEAYLEYLPPKDRHDATTWVKDYPNLILLRTFSKIYGLAGLRLGYAIASPDVAELLNRVRLPFNVGTAVIAAGVAALKDQAFVKRSQKLNKESLAQITQGFNELGVKYIKTYGNFITFRVGDASEVNERLLNQGVIVRPLAGYGMSDYLRVTAGLPAENKHFLEALKAILRP